MKSVFAIIVLALAVGCEHKSPHDDNVAQNGKNPWNDGSGKAGGGSAAMVPPSDPNAVVAPTNGDLAVYTKDIAGTGPLVATIDTSMGTFHCTLLGDKAPMTVANFIGLATGKKPWTNPTTNTMEKGKPFFDGLTFHRVIPGFMIQGGDPLGTGIGGPGYNFDNEIGPDNKVEAGALAMANAGSRGGHGTNGSQFFIMEGARPDLNTKHTVFGQCKETDLVTKIAGVPTTQPGDKPVTPVTITKVTIGR